MNQADVFFQKGMTALKSERSDVALEFFFQAADLGSLDALEKIISITHTEKNFDDYKIAVDKFFAIAEKGNVYTAKKIFNLILNDFFEKEDCNKGAKILLDLANAGHIDSLKFSHELLGMEKISDDYAEEIFKLLADRAKKTHAADLMFRLGECYFFGVGTEKNLNAAKFWFQILINLEMAQDIFERLDVSIAKIYMSNKVDLDTVKKLKNYKGRAKNGDEDAIKNIAEIYRNGKLIKADGNEAVEWFKEISSNANYSKESRIEALSYIAEIYRYGFGGVENDGEKAIHYLELMVNLAGQNSFAARSIAEIYFHGEGNVTPDKDKAVNWLHLAARFGNLFCMKKLAECYATGHLMDKNETEAIYWYEKLLSRSDRYDRIDIMKKIAQIYKNIDKEKSEEWYKKAETAEQMLNFK